MTKDHFRKTLGRFLFVFAALCGMNATGYPLLLNLPSAPCIGAYEVGVEETERNSAGCVSKRIFNRRKFRYDYDGCGRLVEYTDIGRRDGGVPGKRLLCCVRFAKTRMCVHS